MMAWFKTGSRGRMKEHWLANFSIVIGTATQVTTGIATGLSLADMAVFSTKGNPYFQAFIEIWIVSRTIGVSSRQKCNSRLFVNMCSIIKRLCKMGSLRYELVFKVDSSMRCEVTMRRTLNKLQQKTRSPMQFVVSMCAT